MPEMESVEPGATLDADPDESDKLAAPDDIFAPCDESEDFAISSLCVRLVSSPVAFVNRCGKVDISHNKRCTTWTSMMLAKWMPC